MYFSISQLQNITNSNIGNASLYHPHIIEALSRFDIGDRTEHAAFLSQIGHESQNLNKVEEGLFYTDAARLAGIFRRVFDLNKDKVISPYEVEQARPYTRNPKLLAQKLYNNFQGRGLMQLTWEGNYRIIGEMVGHDYVANPDLLLQPFHAALSAVAFWVHSGAGRVADDPYEVRGIINGKARLGLEETTAMFNRAMRLL